MQQFDLKKPKTQRPTTGNDHAPLDLKDMSQQIPKVDDLLGDIDRLLQKTAQKPKKPSPCGC